MSAVSVFSGMLQDERCTLLLNIMEREVHKTLAKADEYSQQNRRAYRDAVKIALNQYARWGLREEMALTREISQEYPGADLYLEYCVTRFARDLSSDLGRVNVTMPTTGAVLRDIHANLSFKPEAYAQSFASDTLAKKVVLADCLRSSLMRFVIARPADDHSPVEVVPESRKAASVAGLLSTDISPDDSISQVMAASASKPPMAPEAVVPIGDSDFQRQVRERIDQMRPTENATSKQDATPHPESQASRATQNPVADGAIEF